MTIAISQHPLSYVKRLDSRCTDCINLVVIHCTELPDLTMAREYGERIHHTESRTGNSGHFYVDRDGSIEQWVPLGRVAHHVRGLNPRSIGIELVNNGRYPDWNHSGHQQMTEPYPEPQIEALISLVDYLVAQLPGLESVTGHEDLDTAMLPSEDQPDIMIRRKLDPGVHFPWPGFLEKILLPRLVTKEPLIHS
jgi:N-acetylmuramoyl-L-alanine amidase